MRPALLLVAALLAAGCVANPPAATTDDATLGAVGELNLGSGVLMHNGGTQHGLSYLHLAEGDEATVTFPEGVLLQDDEGRFVVPEGSVTIQNGALVRYLPPYGASNLTVTISSAAGDKTLDLALGAGESFVSGDLVIELMEIQQAQFPHRSPRMPSYDASMTYFEDYFAALGYEVEVSKYPEWPADIPTPSKTAPSSMNSVVAFKRGTDMADRYVVFGGHFDVVEETTHGAFDNTGGTMAVLALAKAFANVTTSHSIVFAAWGGEEDCICGSQGWLVKHPELVPFIDLYVNYDVTGLAWPAPLAEPAAVVIAAGPDQANTAALHDQHRVLEETWMQTGAEFVYEPIVVGGQVGGAGVNAQSDHVPFMSRGVPVVFQFTSDVDAVLAYIHSEKDTVENMTKFAFGGPEAIETELAPEEMAQGRELLARSYETQMAAGFYWVVLTDAGVLAPTRAGTMAPAALPPLP